MSALGDFLPSFWSHVEPYPARVQLNSNAKRDQCGDDPRKDWWPSHAFCIALRASVRNRWKADVITNEGKRTRTTST